MKNWIPLTLLAALIGASTAPAAWAAPQKVEKVEKKENKQRAGQKNEEQEAGKEKEQASEEKQEEVKEGAEEAAEKGEKTAKKSGADIALLRQVANEESRYRKRNAQLKRARVVAEGKQDEKSLARIDELEKKNQAHYEKRLGQLREKYGAEQVDAAQTRIQTAAKGRRPAEVGAKGKEKSEQAREKGAQKLNQAKGKAKDKGKQARGKSEDRPSGKPQNEGGKR